MTTAADLALIALDPATGASRLGSSAEIALGGAVFHDLLRADRLTVTGEGRKARVQIVSATPLDSPVVDPTFVKLAARTRPVKASDAVTRLGKGLPRRVHADLVAHGLLEDRSHKLLGVVPLHRWTVLPQAGRDELVAGVRGVLLGEREPDERLGALAALVGAAGLVKHVVPRGRRKEATKRAKTLAEGAWASEAVRAAIRASEDAVTVAIVASTVAAGDGGS